MGTYQYQVRDSSGQVRQGSLSATSASAAAAALRSQGMHVLSVGAARNDTSGSSIGGFLARINEAKPTKRHVLDFTTQLAVMIRAGINLRAALEGIADQTTHRTFRKIILELKSDVEAGKQFSDALAKHAKLFGPLYINMVRASEISGSFADMLDRIAGYINQQMETRKMVVGASIYPAIIGILAVGVTIFLLTFVLPKFYAVFEGKEDVLPWATTFLMALSKTIIAQWPLLVAGVGVIAGLIFAALKTEVGSFWFDRFKLSMPL
ncbi:MAG: type II secretion system F family protein, partial [Planctomycetota bacterium]